MAAWGVSQHLAGETLGWCPSGVIPGRDHFTGRGGLQTGCLFSLSVVCTCSSSVAWASYPPPAILQPPCFFLNLLTQRHSLDATSSMKPSLTTPRFLLLQAASHSLLGAPAALGPDGWHLVVTTGCPRHLSTHKSGERAVPESQHPMLA